MVAILGRKVLSLGELSVCLSCLITRIPLVFFAFVVAMAIYGTGTGTGAWYADRYSSQ